MKIRGFTFMLHLLGSALEKVLEDAQAVLKDILEKKAVEDAAAAARKEKALEKEEHTRPLSKAGQQVLN